MFIVIHKDSSWRCVPLSHSDPEYIRLDWGWSRCVRAEYVVVGEGE